MFEYRKSLKSLSSKVSLIEEPLDDKEAVLAAMVEAGKAVVDCGLVDSYFGNLSHRLGDVVYISQTTSSLDELAGLIDACPFDGSSCAGLTASSELSAHSTILADGGIKSILHGHPKFAVIASMLCDEVDCDHKGRCHNLCPKERFIDDTPLVPGEPGSGRYGLSHTLPPAIMGRRGAIVYGHGLFTAGSQGFDIPFRNMIDIELQCVDAYRRKLGTRS
jgi:ribulose-5-phosphate 4-epimerase/fuculose-1-phosphate aldolase